MKLNELNEICINVLIPRPYDNQETMHEEGSGGSHSGGSLKHRRTHLRMVCGVRPGSDTEPMSL